MPRDTVSIAEAKRVMVRQLIKEHPTWNVREVDMALRYKFNGSGMAWNTVKRLYQEGHPEVPAVPNDLVPPTSIELLTRIKAFMAENPSLTELHVVYDPDTGQHKISGSQHFKGRS